MQYLTRANLPEKRVKTIIMSGEYTDIVSRVEALDIHVIKTAACTALPLYEQFHADMQCLHFCGDQLILLKECSALQNKFRKENIEFHLSNSSASSKYPLNILLNCAIVDQFVFCNKKYVDKTVRSLCEKFNKEIISVNQGYTKCSTAIISDKAIITSDDRIYKAGKKWGLDVLRIKEGHINLPGYSHGFIGGCCTLTAKDELIFTGKIENHPDYKSIKSFAANYHIDLISLSNRTLLDIGGLIALQEE